MLTRRRFTALAAAGLSWMPWHRAAAAELPPCSTTDRLEDWELAAWYDADATDASYSLRRRNGTIPLPNRSDMLALTIFDLRYDAKSASYIFQGDTRWPDGVKAEDFVTYDLVNDGATLLSMKLASDHKRQELKLGEATVFRLVNSDTIVRASLGDQKYQVTIAVQSLRRAIAAAQSLAKTVKADHDRKSCAELKSGGCVLTTAACHAVGLPDDCYELHVIRRLRDRWILAQPFGEEALRWYYAISPMILRGLSGRRSDGVFLRFYAGRVLPAVLAERIGWHRGAYRWLRAGVENLAARYADPSETADQPSKRQA